MRNIPIVTKNLLIVNVVAFLACMLMDKSMGGGSGLTDMFGLHFFLASDFHIYQLVTYMFMHGGFQHILFNMFALWMFGCVVERVWGPKKFLFYYMACGVGAGLFQEAAQYITYVAKDMAAYDYVSVNGARITMEQYLNLWTTVGASGAIYAILLAFGMIYPNERLFIFPLPFPIKAKFFVIGYAVIELVSTFSLSDDGVAHIAHLGGMVFGFFLIRYWRKQIGNGYYQSNSADAFDKLKGMFGGKRRAGRTHFTYTKNESYNPTYEQDAECKTNEKVVSQEEIDRILDKIRKEAKNTLEYFERQGVDVKIISGDNPITVSKIAKQVGIKEYNNYIDMSTLKSDKEVKEAALKYTIFGRVSPTQKKALVLALQEKEKTVAMTGDGVNDVLALKASDCSIAMANGSDATKSVAQLILLDSNFASMPKVVAEGRRTINNIQRSASLFLVKTIYSTILALMFLFMGSAYPFVPIQLSLISTVTIGIPSFILALEPNKERIKGEFLKNVVARALPTGLTVALNIFVISILHKNGIIPTEQYSSLCVIATGICGIILLFTLAKSRKSEETMFPVSIFRLSLAIILTGMFVFGLTVLNWWFNIAPIEPMIERIARIIVVSIINFIVFTILFRKYLKIEK